VANNGNNIRLLTLKVNLKEKIHLVESGIICTQFAV
jgi:hypothetical protein